MFIAYVLGFRKLRRLASALAEIKDKRLRFAIGWPILGLGECSAPFGRTSPHWTEVHDRTERVTLIQLAGPGQET